MEQRWVVGGGEGGGQTYPVALAVRVSTAGEVGALTVE